MLSVSSAISRLIAFAGYASMVYIVVLANPNERIFLMVSEFFAIVATLMLAEIFALYVLHQIPKRVVDIRIKQPTRQTPGLGPLLPFFLLMTMVAAFSFGLLKNFFGLYFFLFSCAIKFISFFGNRDVSQTVYDPRFWFRFVILILTAFTGPFWGILYFSINAIISLLSDTAFSKIFRLGLDNQGNQIQKEKPKTVDELMAEAEQKNQ